MVWVWGFVLPNHVASQVPFHIPQYILPLGPQAPCSYTPLPGRLSPLPNPTTSRSPGTVIICIPHYPSTYRPSVPRHRVHIPHYPTPCYRSSVPRHGVHIHHYSSTYRFSDPRHRVNIPTPLTYPSTNVLQLFGPALHRPKHTSLRPFGCTQSHRVSCTHPLLPGVTALFRLFT